MAISDGKADGRDINCGCMEAKYRGWPYVFVVALRGGVREGTELLVRRLQTACTLYHLRRARFALRSELRRRRVGEAHEALRG